jgi:hypothetical protein
MLCGDEQVAAVLTHIRNAWGSSAPAVAPTEVTKLRSSLASRPDWVATGTGEATTIRVLPGRGLQSAMGNGWFRVRGVDGVHTTIGTQPTSSP